MSAILSVREGLEFESPILSDTASVWPAVEALLNTGIEVHCLRDLTRGGYMEQVRGVAPTASFGTTASAPVGKALKCWK